MGQIVLLFGPDRTFLLHVFTTVLFLLGPGGYSVDSLLFGRRLIRSNKPTKAESERRWFSRRVIAPWLAGSC